MLLAISGFIATTAFAAWVIFLGGAEWLEGSLWSGFLFHPLAPTAPATILKLAAVVVWSFHLALFIIDVSS